MMMRTVAALLAVLVAPAAACRCRSAPGAVVLGDVCVFPVVDGSRRVAAASVLPGADWTQVTHVDGTPYANETTESAGGWIVSRGGDYVLINAGLGEVDPPFAGGDPRLIATLRRYGCAVPSTVILSSLRRARTGWTIEHTYFGGDAPTFRAYAVDGAEVARANASAAARDASRFPEMVEPLIDDALVTTLAAGANASWLGGGLVGFPCAGATPGQRCFDVARGREGKGQGPCPST